MASNCLNYESQLCFPLYVCSKEIIRKYKPYLDKLDLTYTQYITLLALWEKDNINIKQLGQKIYLDSGTLTPLLKKLEDKGYIKRAKNKEDERNLVIKLTKAGIDLEKEAKNIPEKVGKCANLDETDTKILKQLLNKILTSFNE